MQNWQPTATVLLLAMVLAVAGYGTFNYQPPPSAWEYRVEVISDADFQATMNGLGRDGWEAVTARRASDGSAATPTFSYEIIFKRPTRHPKQSIIPVKGP